MWTIHFNIKTSLKWYRSMQTYEILQQFTIMTINTNYFLLFYVYQDKCPFCDENKYYLLF